ncbi:hypothetical protein [Micromonospora saelicesensis]|uniref:hypothetical protein n=1 Tax=Micromonospora saelicesensis TaxID=285676 RepID=UPI000DC36ED4|nr:hypothetical protein [Micromonospora saelicesensis]RAO62097.1 hypothetical protein PSN01_01213 [Micromonospora saelicesensis]
MLHKTGTLLTAALLGLTATIGGASAATAAPADTTSAAVSLGNLILEPTERGYRGAIPLTVTNTGSETDYFYLRLREPVPGSFPSGEFGCDAAELTPGDDRRTFGCGLTADGGSSLAPGETVQVALKFDVLTNPRTYAMRMGGGWVEVHSAQGGLVARESFNARFRSTTGSLTNPRLYVQDTQPNAAITAVGRATIDPENSGNLRLPVTVRYRGDAPHLSLYLKASPLPTGSVIQYTIPSEGPAMSDTTSVPGGRMMQGESRSFDVIISPPTEPADSQDIITLEVSAFWYGDVDADPSDNTAQTTLAVATNS